MTKVKPGDLLDDRYQIEELIGRGSHGKVYRAMDLELSSPVAVKLLYGAAATEQGFHKRMEREARAMGQLSGSAAVQVLAFSKASFGSLYLVMEYLEGEDLHRHLVAHEKSGRPLPIPEVYEILEPIAHTLEAAHERGIIHRDIKASNVFVLKSRVRGRSRLCDFGLAKDVTLSPLTTVGKIAGSPGYIAPETWLGRPAPIDHRVDVYAFGVLLFRVLGRQLPFTTKVAIDELVRSVTQGPRPSLRALRPDLDPSIDEWVKRALAPRREDRFQSIAALWNFLDHVLKR
jgi:serine/threonine-protein kinase